MKKIDLDRWRGIIVVLIIFFFAYNSYRIFSQGSSLLVKSKPAAGLYRSDEFIFLRTFYLVKEGVNYYKAFNDSIQNDSRGGSLTKDTLTWRLPTVTYLWCIFANSGFGIGILFIIFSSFSLLAAYKISRKISNNVILVMISPILLIPYFFDAFYYQTSFLFTEWWGLFFFIFGLATLLYDKKNMAIIFFALSILSRELFLIPILAMTLVSFAFKTNRLIFLKILLIFALCYAVHFLNVQKQDVASAARVPWTRIHSFNLLQFQRETAFSMRQYPLLKLHLPFLWISFTIITLILQIFINRKNKQLTISLAYLACSFIPLTILTPFIGVIYNDYWGILFMPLVITLSPVLFFHL